MNIYKIKEFPYVEFGKDIKRQVRLIVSPETTGENDISIVITSLPPGAISEEHKHDDSDEIIYFNNSGEAILDGDKFKIDKNSILHVKKGVLHECRNTSKEELLLFCIFVPAFKPYGKYPELINKTCQYLNKSKL